MDLRDKTVNFLGDSITEGVGVSDVSCFRFDSIIGKKCGCRKVNNYGIGGTRIAHKTQPSEKARHDMNFCGRCHDINHPRGRAPGFGGQPDPD